MTTIEVRLTQGKETKGTYRFEAEDPKAVVTTLYIRKSAFDGGPVPNAIVLRIDTDETKEKRA